MRIFVRKTIKGGRCNAFNQHYKSEISDEVFNIISKELNVNGNISDILEKNFELFNKDEKQYSKEFDRKYDDYRDIIQKKRLNILTKNLTCYKFKKSCLN